MKPKIPLLLSAALAAGIALSAAAFAQTPQESGAATALTAGDVNALRTQFKEVSHEMRAMRDDYASLSKERVVEQSKMAEILKKMIERMDAIERRVAALETRSGLGSFGEDER